MKTLKFYGYSDDLFEMDGALRDEVGCYDKPGYFELTAFGSQGVETMIVGGHYGNSGTWLIGVSPTDEGIPVPAWPMRFTAAENTYSAMLEIDVPGNTKVRALGREVD